MFKVTTIEETDSFGKFALEPLEAGFGHTLGNSLRRVLLTSLEGAAITFVKIDGAPHQFSTLEGISEDVIEIILNLKKVRVKVYSKPVKLVLRSSGKKEVRAKDFEIIGDGEIANGDQLVAVTDPKAKLNIEATAERGKGYSLAEERKNDEIGLIAIDALFSPVITVNYSVEPTRVGRRTDFDKLILEITTDGTIAPSKVLVEAAKILAASFKQIYEPVLIEEEASVSSVVS